MACSGVHTSARTTVILSEARDLSVDADGFTEMHRFAQNGSRSALWVEVGQGRAFYPRGATASNRAWPPGLANGCM